MLLGYCMSAALHLSDLSQGLLCDGAPAEGAFYLESVASRAPAALLLTYLPTSPPPARARPRTYLPTFDVVRGRPT